MADTVKNLSYRIGAICYVIWGLLHIVAAYRIYELGLSQDPTIVQGRLYQGSWNMLYLAVLSIVIAVAFNWKNSWGGYWLNLITISVVDIGFIVLLLLPGYSTDILGPIMWILGAIFTTIGILKAPRTA